MEYRCETISIEGFVQQVAVACLARGYWFYVMGCVPAEKDPLKIDAKLIERYGITASRKIKARHKLNGRANLAYVRHGRLFVLLATHGHHDFFAAECGQVRDARRVPIKFKGYSISFRNGHSSVRIEREEYKQLKADLLDLALRRSIPGLMDEFARIRFVPYAPVRVQLLNIWRAVNQKRAAAGQAPVPIECVPWKRRIVKPFGEQEPGARKAA